MALDTNESQTLPVQRPDPRFYSTRNKVSIALVIFIVVVGLPIIGVPSLRGKLYGRVMALKSAMSGEIKPAMLNAGSNHEPFPAEFERPEPPPPQAALIKANLDKVFTTDGAAINPATAAGRRAPAKGAKPGVAPVPLGAAAEPAETQPPVQSSAPGENEPKYQRGKAEQDAYDILLKVNPVVAGLIEGKDPSLKFRSWDAAGRGDDVFWVRLKFQAEGIPDSEYIWQVKVQANQAIPLNYNARNLAQ